MGAGLGSNGGKRSGNTRRRSGFSEINVTPMVDVMLVLLIIFMVAAPMLTSGVQVDLPKAQSAPVQGQDEPITVTIQKNHHVYIQKTLVSVEELGEKLKAIVGEKPETRIFLRGDKDVDYGSIMKAVGEINAAGFSKVALITEQKEDTRSHKGR